jgi:hypothetical protein
MSFLYQVTIGGSVVSGTDLIGFDFERNSNSDFSVVSVELPVSALTSYSISNGDSVVIQYGKTSATEHYLFRGTVENINPRATSVVLDCFDKLYQLGRRVVNESYDKNDSFAGKISSIMIDLITNYGGLNADTSSIQDTGTLIIKDKLFCFDSIVLNKVKELSTVADYTLYYNPEDDKVYAQEKGYYDADDNFEVGLNVIGKPSWNYDSSTIINYLRLYGSSKTVNTVELFDGTGVKTTFELAYVPDKKANIKVEVDSGAGFVEQVFGRVGTTVTFDYTIDDDPKIKSVIFQSGSIPPVGVDNVRVTYSYNDVLFTERWDDVSKANYPMSDGGYRYKTLINKSIETVDDLENIAASIINEFKDTFDKVSFTATDLTTVPRLGDLSHISDVLNDEDRDLIISRIHFQHPGGVFDVDMTELTGEVTNVLFTNEQRLRTLEEESRGNVSFIPVSVQNSPELVLLITQIISAFDTWDDVWDTTNFWSTSDNWGVSVNGDDFSIDLTATKWDEASGSWSVANGYYSQTNTSGNHYSNWDYAGYEDWQDPDMTFKLRKLTGHNAGVLLRFDGTNGYCIRYKDANKIELGTFNISTGFSQISEHDFSKALNTWEFWRVIIKGSNIILLVSDDMNNWIKVISANDSTYFNAGAVGLITFSTDADFDEFKVGECETLEVEA